MFDEHATALVHGGAALDYRLRRSQRKTLSLLVHRDGRLEARAPLSLARREIEAFIISRAEWIARKRAQFAALAPEAATPLVDGRLAYLGGMLTLVLRQGRGLALRVGDELRLTLPYPDNPDAVALAVKAWYLQEAQAVLPTRLAALWPQVAAWGKPMPQLRFRWMRSRWGSCSRDGRIALNTQLLKAPLDAIDYVLAHELCHLREFNHGPGFYALLSALLPDWPARKRLLDEVGSLREL